MSAGKSVRLFLAEGTPGGLLTAEIMNWTGHVLAAPRSDLAALLKREETGRTGVYILLGDDPEGLGGLLSYIGEGDEVRKRLYQHAQPEKSEGGGGKDFWDRVIVLTNKDANLTKAHARYLESRLLSIAGDAKRTSLANRNSPEGIPLPEADISDMEYYITQVMIVLPVLGVNILRSVKTVPQEKADTESGPADSAFDTSPTFELRLPTLGIIATAAEVDGEFTVLKGSHARSSWSGVHDHNYRQLWEQLVQSETLVLRGAGSSLEFSHDQVFKSPSAAAACVAGRSANGRVEWKIKGTSTTYGKWQEQVVNDATKTISDLEESPLF